MSDLLAYDSEATDADVRHGQMTQFGAIRADADMNPISSTLIEIARLGYVVPAPRALEVTGMDPFDLDAPGLRTEYQAAAEIERLFHVPWGGELTLLTFNGVRFDDELIRTTLFRNLRSPWFSSGKGVRRVDLLPLVQLVNAAEPGAIKVPLNAEGRPSFRLEHLAPANGIPIRAHHAAGDAEATLELARLVKQRAPWAWAAALACGNAASVEAQMRKAANDGSVLWHFTHFGTPDAAPCAVLGTDGKKKWILADRRRPAGDFPLEAVAAGQGLYTRESPYRIVKAGAAPLIVDASVAARVAQAADAGFVGHPIGFFKAGSPLSKASPAAEAAVAALRASSYESEGSSTSEERIYAGFPGDADKAAMAAFHRAPDWEARAAITFPDARLADFAGRLVVAAAEAGLAPSLHQSALDAARSASAEAWSRPGGPSDARHMTLERARAEGADGRWEEWAEATFPAQRDEVQAADAPCDARGQFSLGL